MFDLLNANFKEYFDIKIYSIDESMIPYYGKYGTKQFMRKAHVVWLQAMAQGLHDRNFLVRINSKDFLKGATVRNTC